MPDPGRNPGSLLRYGCYGCLGCLGLLVLIAAVIFGVAMMSAPSEPIEAERVTRELPEPVPVSPEALEADFAGAPDAMTAAGGRIILDLAQAEFDISPGLPGDPLRVEGLYNRSGYTLEESLEKPADVPWTYSVRFRRNAGAGFFAWLGETLTGTSPKLNITIPPDVPIELVLTASRGEVVVDLAGLWLTSADVDLSMGGADLNISSPLRAPIDRLSIKAGMGGGSFRNIGNASPRELDIEFSMGGLHLDLTGAWQRDADISIRHKMGGGAVQLPRNARIEGLPSGSGPKRDRSGSGLPVLRFRVSSEMGDIEFID